MGLVISGGHTSLYLCQGPTESEFLGGTLDDAAGEAFDKVASLLGLGYPGGPEIEKAAHGGNATAFKFPRPFLHDERLVLSFSGLKTAVLYALHGVNARDVVLDPSAELIGDLAASFQEAVVDAVVAKTHQALTRTGMKRLGVGGGVAANSRMRQKLGEMAHGLGVELFIPPPSLCTDNAAMAGIALPKLAAGPGFEPRRGRHGRPGPPRPCALLNEQGSPLKQGAAAAGAQNRAATKALEKLSVEHRADGGDQALARRSSHSISREAGE